MAPLINLVDFSEETNNATRAAMILDVMFFDMAVDSGLVATISQTATEDKAVAVYEAMTGRSASPEVIEWAKGLTPQMQRHFLEERPGDKYIPENTQEDYIASEVKEMASEDLAKSGSDRFDQVFLKVLTNG